VIRPVFHRPRSAPSMFLAHSTGLLRVDPRSRFFRGDALLFLVTVSAPENADSMESSRVESL